MSKESVYKCCYNCANASSVYIPPEEKCITEDAIRYLNRCKKFATKRVCENNSRMPVYPMHEKRYCKGFEPDELINEYYKPEKEK